MKNLKSSNGLSWYEWRRGDGVLCIELTGEGFLTDPEVSKLHAEFLDESSFEILAKDDCNIYLPSEDSIFDMFSEPLSPEEELESRLFLVFRKGALTELCEEAYEGVKKATSIGFQSKNRGVAGGKVDPTRFGRDAGRVVPVGDGTRARYVSEDGILSATLEANITNSSVIGFYPATGRAPYVRKTRYTRDYSKHFVRSLPYLQESSRIFEKECAAKSSVQRAFLEEQRLIENEWVVENTLYTTITVNKNFQTACHQDAGDLKAGMECFGVIERGPHKYKGGYTVFPKIRVAFDCRDGDWVAMDIAHHYHGNTPILPAVEGEEDFERISLVMYVREDLAGAGTQEEEEAKYQEWLRVFRNPQEQHKHRKALHEEELQKDSSFMDEFGE